METGEKICTKCNLPKPLNRFRFRSKRGYTWQQGKCMDCETKEQNERYHSDIEKHREKGRIAARNFRIERPGQYKEYTKKQRQSEAYKKNRKKYWRENEQHRNKHRVRAKKNQEENRDNLTDRYVVAHIIQRTSLTPEDIPKELIEVVRQIKILKRKTREYVKQSNSKNP